MAIKIREFEEKDKGKLLKVFHSIKKGEPEKNIKKYVKEHKIGKRKIIIAFLKDKMVGYLNIIWVPVYPYFKKNKIPCVQDMNVLEEFRREGVASRLMNRAESIVRKKSKVIGIGVGLSPGYNIAQRMYVKRGYIPDGRGLVYEDKYCKNRQKVIVGDDLVLHLVKILK